MSSVGFQALATLPFLRKFIFLSNRSGKWLPEQQKCLLLCTQFLPKLKIAGAEYKFKIPFADNGYLMDFIHNLVFEQPHNLSLQQVFLGTQVTPHPNVQLPELQSVLWESPFGDFLGFFNKFQTITELGFFSAYDEVMVMQVLMEVGWRLTKLVFWGLGHRLSLSTVFTLCPNLKHACFEMALLRFPDHSAIFPQNVLRHLEEFDLTFDMDHDDAERMCDNQCPKGFIEQVHSIKIINCILYYEMKQLL